jgi:hypothetical protein
MVLLQFEEELLILNTGDTDPPNYPVQARISGRMFDKTRYQIFSQIRY